MLDPEPEVPRTETFAQTFSIRYDYPVHFTRDLFDQRNPCLRQVLMPGPSARPQRLAVFIDDGVTLAWPQLAGRIDRKSTRLNSSHTVTSYAVFCLKKKS